MVKHQNNLLEGKILTLPKSDFPSLQLGNSNKRSTAEDNDNDDIVDPPLLLFSLPPSLEMSDLASSEFFLSDDSECRLVNESKGITLDLIKVESSNAYVMFHPTKQPKMTNTSNDEHNDNYSDQNKLRGRLLRENNTFFVECEQPKANLKQMITEHLTENCIYPPSTGISIRELSQKFKFSQKEVTSVLESIDAFQIPLNDSNKDDSCDRYFGVLSEEVERDTWNVIIAVLSEWDGSIDYAQAGVVLDDMVKVVMTKYDDSLVEGVVRHCLDQCTIDTSNNESDTSPVRLDPKFVSFRVTCFYHISASFPLF